MNTVHFASGQMSKAELSGLLDATADIENSLANFFVRFGEIRKISKLDRRGNGYYYCIDFADSAAAVNAANATGCCKYGFNTLLIDLATLKCS